MLIRTIRAEAMKLSHSSIWLAFFVLPIIPAFMGTFNYLQNMEILTDQWYSLWTQNTLFTCYFFLPALIAVYCSYTCRLEHTNRNWNAVMTVPIPTILILAAKWLIVTFMILLTHIWIGILYLISGALVGVTGHIPVELTTWLFFGLLGSSVICGVQICLSLYIRSFAVPIGIALMGGIGGLLATSRGLGIYLPYALLNIGMRANNPREPMVYGVLEFLISCVIFLCITAAVSVIWYKHKLVKD